MPPREKIFVDALSGADGTGDEPPPRLRDPIFEDPTLDIALGPRRRRPVGTEAPAAPTVAVSAGVVQPGKVAQSAAPSAPPAVPWSGGGQPPPAPRRGPARQLPPQARQLPPPAPARRAPEFPSPGAWPAPPAPQFPWAQHFPPVQQFPGQQFPGQHYPPVQQFPGQQMPQLPGQVPWRDPAGPSYPVATRRRAPGMPPATPRKKSGGIWAVLVIVIMFVVFSGSGQHLIHTLIDVLNR